MDPEEVRRKFERFIAALPNAEPRPGQVDMAAAVARAIDAQRHLLVQAGTGTGKSLAYLVPAVLSGKKVVVATATKALQEQLVGIDLPLVARHLGVPFEAALLKGRSNYLCRAALAQVSGTGQGTLVDIGPRPERLAEIAEWAETSDTGDRADLPFAVTGAEWSTVSVGVGECPGAHRCKHGDECFAEDARARAAAADVLVVNTHLYGVHLAAGSAVLPEHDLVVIDEAHALEDVMADAFGLAVGPGRLAHLARAFRGLFTADDTTAGSLEAAGARLATALEPVSGQRVDPAAGELATILLGVAEVVASAQAKVRGLEVTGEAVTTRERLLSLSGGLVVDLRVLGELGEDRVAWVEGAPLPQLRVAPVDVGAELAATLFDAATVVLTSATLTVGGRFEPLAERLGLLAATASTADPAGPAGDAGASSSAFDSLDVGSPFDYERQGLLYCAAHLPDPRSTGYEEAMLAELEALITAAGGRTLALFTSRRVLDAAAAHLEGKVPGELLVQDRLPRPVLRDRFLASESATLLATMGFWQGFDAPGRTCSLVVIDRLPFSRPDDPLAEARRRAATRARRNAFAAVDLPRAATLLAQGAGRLIRSGADRGVVAVLDRRLATASYKWTLVRSLPPMRRTRDPVEVRTFLAAITSDEPASTG